MFALVDPEATLARRDLLIDVAAAGDFATYRSRDAARISMASRRSRIPTARRWTSKRGDNTATLYEELLGRLPELLDHTDRYGELWAREDATLTESEELVRSGRVRIEEDPELDLAVLHLPDGASDVGGHRFGGMWMRGLHPMAINNATDRFALLCVRGRQYDFSYRYESWVQYQTCRPRPRVDLRPFAAELSSEELGDARLDLRGSRVPQSVSLRRWRRREPPAASRIPKPARDTTQNASAGLGPVQLKPGSRCSSDGARTTRLCRPRLLVESPCRRDLVDELQAPPTDLRRAPGFVQGTERRTVDHLYSDAIRSEQYRQHDIIDAGVPYGVRHQFRCREHDVIDDEVTDAAAVEHTRNELARRGSAQCWTRAAPRLSIEDFHSGLTAEIVGPHPQRLPGVTQRQTRPAPRPYGVQSSTRSNDAVKPLTSSTRRTFLGTPRSEIDASARIGFGLQGHQRAQPRRIEERDRGEIDHDTRRALQRGAHARLQIRRGREVYLSA